MTFHPTFADRRFAAAASHAEGLLARMVRLWIEHHQRMLDLGIRPH